MCTCTYVAVLGPTNKWLRVVRYPVIRPVNILHLGDLPFLKVQKDKD